MITKAQVHHTILRHIIDHGFAPSLTELSQLLRASESEIADCLKALEAYHGVVLHPHKPEVHVIHPFSTAPTNFFVQAGKRAWWGNCAWCSLGIAALIDDDVKITTTLGAETKQVEINIVDGIVREKNYFIHFPIPMKNAWDNVLYTCSNMLIFENKVEVAKWSARHRIPMGDIQPIETIWEFSKKWYGNHLAEDWTKWTADEAKRLFAEHHLTGEIWQLDGSGERF